MNKPQAKPETIWTRLGATKQENSATGVIHYAEEVSGKKQRWVATAYISNNSSFNRGIQLPVGA